MCACVCISGRVFLFCELRLTIYYLFLVLCAVFFAIQSKPSIKMCIHKMILMMWHTHACNIHQNIHMHKHIGYEYTLWHTVIDTHIYAYIHARTSQHYAYHWSISPFVSTFFSSSVKIDGWACIAVRLAKVVVLVFYFVFWAQITFPPPMSLCQSLRKYFHLRIS